MKTNNSFFYMLLLLFAIISPSSLAQTFKIATIAPDGSYWMKQMKQGSDEISRKTSGRVKFKYYPGGVMGDDKTILKKIRTGQLHGGAMPGGSLAKYYPDSMIYSLPLAFHNFEEVDYVRSHMDQKIIEGFEQGGFVTFGLGEGGLAYAMSNAPIVKTSDLLKQKIWSPHHDSAALLTLQAFDITPIPLALSDVLTGLQTNMIDTVATSPIAAIALQWHTQIKYITDVPLVYFYAVLAIDKKPFSKLSVEDQQIVRDVMTHKFKIIDRQNRKDNLSAFDVLGKRGITIIRPNADELAGWYLKSGLAIDSIAKKSSISTEVIDQLITLLREFRQHQSQAKTQY